MSIKVFRGLTLHFAVAISIVLTSCNSTPATTPLEQKKLADQEHERQTKEYNDYMNSLAGIDLDPEHVTLGDLRKLLKDQGDRGAVVRPETFDWVPMDVEASFVGAALQPISDVSKPYYLKIGPVDRHTFLSPFPGSLRGFKIGDPVSKLVLYGKGRGYAPDVAHRTMPIDSKWYVVWTDKDGNLESIAICRKGYSILFGPEPGSPPLD